MHKHIKVDYRYCSEYNEAEIEDIIGEEEEIQKDFQPCLTYSEYSKQEMQDKINAKVQILLDDIADVQMSREVAKEEVDIGAIK